MNSLIAERSSNSKITIKGDFTLRDFIASMIFFLVSFFLFLPFLNILSGELLIFIFIFWLIITIGFIIFLMSSDRNEGIKFYILFLYSIKFLFFKKIINHSKILSLSQIELNVFNNENSLQKINFLKFKDNTYLEIFEIQCDDIEFLNADLVDEKINNLNSLFLRLSIYKFDILKTSDFNSLKEQKNKAKELNNKDYSERINNLCNSLINKYYIVIYYDSFTQAKKSNIKNILFSSIILKKITDYNIFLNLVSEFNFYYSLRKDQNWKIYKNYIKDDNGTFYAIKSINKYPSNNYYGWFKSFEVLKDEANLIIKCNKINKIDIIKKLDISISNARMHEARKTSQELNNESKLDKYIELLEKIKLDQEEVLVCETYIFLKSNSLKRIQELDKKLKALAIELKFTVKNHKYNQLDMFKLGIGKIKHLNKWKKTAQELTTSALASFYCFEKEVLKDKNGLYLSNHMFNNQPCFFDPKYKDNIDRTSNNIIIFGKTGYGKTFNITQQIKWNLLNNVKTFIIDPSREYHSLLNDFDGEIIDIGAGNNFKINLLEVFNNDIKEHIKFVISIIEKLGIDFSYQNKHDLKELLNILYKNFNIDFNDLGKNNNWPILSDLLYLANKQKRHIDKSTIIKIHDLANYDAYRWNVKSNVKFNKNLIIFDTYNLSTDAKTKEVELFLLISLINKEIIKNYKKNLLSLKAKNERKEKTYISLVIDEAHLLINRFSLLTLQYIYHLTKTIRKYNGILYIITQNLYDFLGDKTIETFTKGIINNMQYMFFHKLNGNEIEILNKYLKNEIKLQENQKKVISSLKQGECVLKYNDNFIYLNKIEPFNIERNN